MIKPLRHFIRPERPTSSAEDIADRPLRSKLTVKGERDYLDEVTISDGNKSVLLNKYLPERVRFNGRRGNIFGFMLDVVRAPDPSPDGLQLGLYSLVLFPPERTDTLEGRIALLHEIGHAMLPRNEKAGRNNRYLKIAEEIISEIQSTGEFMQIAPSMRSDYLLRIFQHRWNVRNAEKARMGESMITNAMLVEAIKYRVQEERESSANALKLHKQIKKKEGIDILGGATTEEIFKIINEISLRSHEEAYGFLLRLPEKETD